MSIRKAVLLPFIGTPRECKGHEWLDDLVTSLKTVPAEEVDLALVSIMFAKRGFDPRIGGEYESLIRDLAAMQAKAHQLEHDNAEKPAAT